ncbi:hypothetical protein L3V82_04565 [Thiotrichales bacterium 19S3-7]|nr:hypothetical protein [Thiotrichales bacterium 19S3-7]MCF6801369.1 hypothetical protein [Thiotrichales bacterium 19S3-11]
MLTNDQLKSYIDIVILSYKTCFNTKEEYDKYQNIKNESIFDTIFDAGERIDNQIVYNLIKNTKFREWEFIAKDSENHNGKNQYDCNEHKIYLSYDNNMFISGLDGKIQAQRIIDFFQEKNPSLNSLIEDKTMFENNFNKKLNLIMKSAIIVLLSDDNRLDEDTQNKLFDIINTIWANARKVNGVNTSQQLYDNFDEVIQTFKNDITKLQQDQNLQKAVCAVASTGSFSGNDWKYLKSDKTLQSIANRSLVNESSYDDWVKIRNSYVSNKSAEFSKSVGSFFSTVADTISATIGVLGAPTSQGTSTPFYTTAEQTKNQLSSNKKPSGPGNS